MRLHGVSELIGRRGSVPVALGDFCQRTVHALRLSSNESVLFIRRPDRNALAFGAYATALRARAV